MSRFNAQYRKWLDECLEEYNNRFPPRKFHQESEPDDYGEADMVEFSEDGSAYPHGIGGVSYISNVVTPWEESEHYIHWRE